MAIKNIKVSNFKSFNTLDLDLRGFNLLIGSNASGKSNFIHIFDFLRDVASYSLENAISMQGGVRYLRNITLGSSQNFIIDIIADDELGRLIKRGSYYFGIKTERIHYRFEIKFNKRGFGFQIVDDALNVKYNIFSLNRLKGKRNVFKDDKKISEGQYILRKNKTRVKHQINIGENSPLKKEDIIPSFFEKDRFPEKTLLMETVLFSLPFDLKGIFDISINDFDPKLPKKATPITGKAILEEDGSNLAIIIQNIIQHKKSRRKFFNLVKDILPFISKLDIDKFADKSVLVKLEEKYTKGKYLPASLVSDGTLNVVALIIALYFNRKKFSIIEEPERNIHPYLISRIMNMMKDASRRKQLIVTTHNPEMVKYSELKDLLLISRTKDGFSSITRPVEEESVHTFLSNEVGIAEIFSKNLFKK